MALKAVHVSDVPKLDQVQENALFSARFPRVVKAPTKQAKFLVIGHRGSGMNMLQSSDCRMKAIKENTILSFNAAGKFAVDFVEFDVQVTSDDCAVIFHDNFILTEQNGTLCEKRVTELTSDEFFSYGPQRDLENVKKTLMRKTKDGRIFNWTVENDESFCTLKEAFEKVDCLLGFNIELKFDDYIVYQDEELIHTLKVILQVVSEYAKERPVIFSTFQPSAAVLMNKLQNTYPVYFLTNGGSEVYTDVRRNSLDEAVKLCLDNGLQGIVSQVKAVFKNPEAITKIKNHNLSFLTYGQLNNVPEAVYMQHLMGIDGVIVDLVKEITLSITDFFNPAKDGGEESKCEVGGQLLVRSKPKFSEPELSFLLTLIPHLIQH
ncbi:hypothetical protein GIB67_041836 [Kingdonia uniflora]|uniref:glycerophosphodiester phosphodiesterase n=1 Tax=Kingdonia uniflora TaxID=39325 RepID=A0A7J7L5V4_9MAGN|nr:hypothetical protein GIB67_041836 [Kingdonia uniflora]